MTHNFNSVFVSTAPRNLVIPNELTKQLYFAAIIVQNTGQSLLITTHVLCSKLSILWNHQIVFWRAILSLKVSNSLSLQRKNIIGCEGNASKRKSFGQIPGISKLATPIPFIFTLGGRKTPLKYHQFKNTRNAAKLPLQEHFQNVFSTIFVGAILTG